MKHLVRDVLELFAEARRIVPIDLATEFGDLTMASPAFAWISPEFQHAYRRRHAEHGLCRSCKTAAIPGLRVCAVHREKNRARMAALRSKR
jgi:hypothetical protein